MRRRQPQLLANVTLSGNELKGTVKFGVFGSGGETPEQVAARIRRALPFTDPRNIIVCTDCGMKHLPRDVAYGKMKAMVDGASLVRQELQSN
jgi:hypothetical protein